MFVLTQLYFAVDFLFYVQMNYAGLSDMHSSGKPWCPAHQGVAMCGDAQKEHHL